MTTILLTGATGQVGWELARALMPLGRVVAPERGICDLARPESLDALVDSIKPTVIVNAAAYTAVDKAEAEPELAQTVNAAAPAELAKAARRHGALLVHYSTDYVFDGTKATPYSEDDTPCPVSVYGKTKLAGDEAVRASGADHVIFRTSWIFSARGNNFLKTILRLAGEQDELRVVADQFGAPTWARLIAETTVMALHQVFARRESHEFESGIFNLTAGGSISWHGFASAILAGARERGAKLKCNNAVSITTAEYPVAAQRPANSRLSGDKLKAVYGLSLPDWKLGLHMCLAELFPS